MKTLSNVYDTRKIQEKRMLIANIAKRNENFVVKRARTVIDMCL